ncbi:MAG: hypothetical protein ACI80V_002918 [Rhodothermales bacterium]|jgi:hypothetical protein
MERGRMRRIVRQPPDRSHMASQNNPIGLIALLLLTLLPLGCESGPTTARPRSAVSEPAGGPSTAEQMTAAAAAFLGSLSEEARQIARFTLEEDQTPTGWSNLPASFVSRVGVRYGDLDGTQRRLLHGLFRASTSSQGYQKIAGIIRLDGVLHEEASAAVSAGTRRLPPDLVESWTPENYWVSFYGTPGEDEEWAWLLSGHHLAGNFTVAGNRTSFTPMFLGAEPNEVQEGLEAGWKILSHEPARGIEVMQSLSGAQQTHATLQGDVPRDILAGPGNKGRLTALEGLSVAEMTEDQQRLVWAVVQEFVSNADHDAADAQLQQIRDDGLASLHFAWLGP